MRRRALFLGIALTLSGCASSSNEEVTSLRSRVERLSHLAASGGGINVAMLPDPVTGAEAVSLEYVFSFDRYHALCRVDTNPRAFKMATHEMGEIVIAPRAFFMAMFASTVDQFVIEILVDRPRKVMMHGILGSSTEIRQDSETIGSRTAVETGTYQVEAVDGGVGGGPAGDSFALTAFFDPVRAPVNYRIFGPRVTFTGRMVEGEITIVDPQGYR